jgi:hypothetical protein
MKALGFWKVGVDYLHLVECVVAETIKQGNANSIPKPSPISEDEYEQETKWSDHNLILPVLFDFYHALEVIFKGFLISSGRLIEQHHKLSMLLAEFESCFPNHRIGLVAGKYINQDRLPPLIASFCNESGISIDEYYQALKYPERKDGSVVYAHYPLKYQDKFGLAFFEEFVEDVNQIRTATLTLGKSLCPAV